MSGTKVEGSGQPAETKRRTQTMSHLSETLHQSRDQVRSQDLGNQSTHTQLMEVMQRLQQTVEDYITQLKTQHLQPDLGLGEQRHSQAAREQEAILVRLMCQVVNLLQPCPPLDSSGHVGGGQQAQSSRQPDQLGHHLSDLQATVVSCDLSTRGSDISALYHSSIQGYKTYQGDKYHEDKNPLGFINLGVSENKLCIDLMTERLSRSDMHYIEDALLQYADWRGQPFLREEVARFLAYYCKAPAPLDPENVVVLNGCCSVFSALAMVLCEPGEAFLTPTPFYGGFAFTSHLYSKVELIHVHLDSEVTDTNTCPFQLSVGKLETTLLEARLKGKHVRGLLLINPQNPLGDVYSEDALKEYLEFAKRYNLHVIIDEMYILSVFDESITFHSVLSMETLPDPQRIHVIWGTSKDFGISGFRFGALYTQNKEVASAVSSFGYLHSISGIAQYKLCRLLQDREWIDKVYLPTNRSRLQAAHKYITNNLKALKIPFLNRGSGLYIWINLKKYLDPCTFEQELLLHHRFLENKLLLARGKSYMCTEPGWFRLIFSEKPLCLKSGMHRFFQTLGEQKQDCTEKQQEDALREQTVCLLPSSSSQSHAGESLASASGP
ncbi:1-aminocyclopropane-1-carboxylate synthase-like protein (inactive) like [Rhinolophus ferrumequinum]|uniref:1-aminocyclopropane-1-carboxylate synthase-like protein (Inactive) like n=1 Tax=Rhinolophus ferrumequinum TaxID=59479 RepID=A0A7J7W4L9_RHIFE|nr:1-aminocyclopropane-1-carboxylate synthase-like protein (inactive) like [Rhinolophus ferrumequinum]